MSLTITNKDEIFRMSEGEQLRDYMDRQMAMLQQYKKFVEGMADKTIEHNVNITVMNEQIAVMRDAIRDVMLEFNPDVVTIFMDKLNKKLNSLEYVPKAPEEVNTKQLNIIEAQILSDEDE